MTNESMRRWIKAIAISLVVFLIFSVYLFLRRGYYNVYIINKVFGSTAAMLAGITLLMGPLRRISFVASLMTIRRHLGLLAFGFAILHVIASLAQSDRFAWFSWYLSEWVPITFGVVAIFVWAYMTYISRNRKIEELGVDVWKNRLSLAGKIGFLAIFLHLVIMKYQGWIRWFTGQVKASPELANPEFPPASLFVFLCMVFVIVYRLALFISRKRKRVG